MLFGTDAVYTPDSNLPAFSLRTQQPLLVPAGQVTNATYFIDFGEDYQVAVCEPAYGTDDETAINNSYVLTGHDEYSFGNVQMGHYVNTVEDIEAMVAQMNAAYEEAQAQANAQNQAEAEAQAEAQAEKDELLGEIVSDIAGKAFNDLGNWIEEETNGYLDKEMQNKIYNYLCE